MEADQGSGEGGPSSPARGGGGGNDGDGGDGLPAAPTSPTSSASSISPSSSNTRGGDDCKRGADAHRAHRRRCRRVAVPRRVRQPYGFKDA